VGARRPPPRLRIADVPQRDRDAGRREPEPRPWTGAEAHGAQLAGVLVHPPAGLAVQAGNLGGVDQRLGLFRHETAEPNGESIREEVGEPVERGIVVDGGLAASPRRGAKRDWRLGSHSLRPRRSGDLRPPPRWRVGTGEQALDEGSVRPDRQHLALVNRHVS
jgi:hypothetical protein